MTTAEARLSTGHLPGNLAYHLDNVSKKCVDRLVAAHSRSRCESGVGAMRAFLLAFLLLPLAACGTVKEVRLQHPDTGKIAVCKGKSGLNNPGYTTDCA